MRLEVFVECAKKNFGKEKTPDLSEKYKRALQEKDKTGLTGLESAVRPEPSIPGKLKSRNLEFCCFSDCVEVKETKVQGRFTVASRDISPG